MLCLTEEIRNYQVPGALPAKLRGVSEEYYSLAVLKYSFPQVYSKLHKSEAPDLQDNDGYLGIEITSALSQADRQISSESVKYSHAKNSEDREKSLRIIQANGGNRNEYFTRYPVGNAEKDKRNVQNAYSNKLLKLKDYRKKCSVVGLMITIDIPLFFFYTPKWAGIIPWCGTDDYDFVIISHWSGIDTYDRKTGQYDKKRIDHVDMDALKRLGYMTAKGLIKEDDPVWG